ncbi:putative glycosyltransferase family 25 protein [Rosellinia necatrix]|uniref:Putative glycosyltransferase family 25 protein n=1 Tax=Rosellinia necatrix TaxID=77044 RepID=A0A1W2TUZ8_ROSNE|nr:putative glycosyltransferase family 25 protein [Rosellinia necatrix]
MLSAKLELGRFRFQCEVAYRIQFLFRFYSTANNPTKAGYLKPPEFQYDETAVARPTRFPRSRSTQDNNTMSRYRRSPATILLLVLLSLAYYVYIYTYALRPIPQAQLSRTLGDDEDVLNSTLGVADIFVINLPSRPDRRQAMAAAANVSGLTLTFLDGLRGGNVPPARKGKSTGDGEGPGSTVPASAGARGSWLAHRNALRAVVDGGRGSALVLEDDVDWDARLKAQMRTFAAAARTWLRADITTTTTTTTTNTNTTENDARSPYGDGWDVLWLGHCGADLPGPSVRSGGRGGGEGDLVVAIADDATVPAPKHLRPHPSAPRDALAARYPAHTRVVHAAAGGNACTLAYAVSRRGARDVLRRFGRAGYAGQWDLMLRDYCAGRYGGGGRRSGGEEDEKEDETEEAEEEEEEGEKEKEGEEKGARGRRPVCLTVQPPLVSHYYAGAGGDGGGGGASVSDIGGFGGGFARRTTGTPYVRLSVQANLGRLAAGAPVDELVDQLPDDGDTLW